MKLLKLFLIAVGVILALQTNELQKTNAQTQSNQTIAIYRIDAGRSQFMVHAFRGGLLSFKGHDHFIKVGTFTGEVQITPSVVSPASLSMTIRAGSLEETGADFTASQNKSSRRISTGLYLNPLNIPKSHSKARMWRAN